MSLQNIAEKIKQRTSRTPNAFAIPPKVASENNGPTPPYINTCDSQQVKGV